MISSITAFTAAASAVFPDAAACAVISRASVAEAQNAAYTLADQISWLGEFHRSDIGWRAIDRERG